MTVPQPRRSKRHDFRMYLEGCDCDECAESHRQWCQARQDFEEEGERMEEELLGRAAPSHGTRQRYATGCHCEACRSANADYQAAWRRESRRA